MKLHPTIVAAAALRTILRRGQEGLRHSLNLQSAPKYSCKCGPLVLNILLVKLAVRWLIETPPNNASPRHPKKDTTNHNPNTRKRVQSLQ